MAPMYRMICISLCLVLLSAAGFNAHAHDCRSMASAEQAVAEMADLPCHSMAGDMQHEPAGETPGDETGTAHCCCPAVPAFAAQLALFADIPDFATPRARLGNDQADTVDLAFEPPPPRTHLL